MALSPKIYAEAKKWVRDNLKNYDLFDGDKASEDVNGPNEDVNGPKNLYTLACLRLLLQDPVVFTDPIEKGDAFEGVARSVRLNEFGTYGKNIDLGFGTGTSNNLMYKLAYEFFKKKDNWSEIKESRKTKAGFIALAFANDEFTEEFLANVILDDRYTYESITKQAFYTWHYENFINTTALKDVIKKENAGDGSVVNWSDVVVKKDGFSVFISRSGAPFNAGFPVICVVFEGTREDTKKADEIAAKAFDYLFPLVGRKKYSDLTPDEKSSIEEFVWVKEFNHKNDDPNKGQPFRYAGIEDAVDTIKFCVGADYAQLVWGLGKADAPPQSYYDFVEYGLANLAEANSRYELIQKSLSATNDKPTDVVFDEQLAALSEALVKKDEAVQNGPALFFDLANKDELWYQSLLSDLKKYEGIDSPEVVDAILKPQYSLSLKNTSETIKETYAPLIEQYKIQRSADPRILTMDFDTAKVLEDIIFYYDQSFNLLAIGAAENKSTKEAPAQQQDRKQKNNIPFEFTDLADQPLSDLDKYYSILPLPPEDNTSGLMGVGLQGPILIVTQYFVDALSDSSNYKKVLDTLDEVEVLIYPSNPTGDPDSIFIQKDDKTVLRENAPFFVPYTEMGTKVVGANEVFATLLLKSANRFFISGNEIVLGDSKGGVYSFATKSLEVAGGVVDFFTTPTTFQDADLISADNVQVFLDRFYYPKLLIKPTVRKQKAVDVDKDEGKALKKNEGAPSTKKAKNKKVVDLDDYNSANKLFAKQVFVIAAQSSNSPCLTELANIVKTGKIEDVYIFLLTKFPWDQMVAKSLLANLRRISNLIDTEASRQFADQINACLRDLNVEKILAAFANFKNSFKNLDNIIGASLPEIPKLGQAVPYIYILDFQKITRDALFKALAEAVFASLGFLLGIMLKDLLAACEQDGSLQSLMFDSNKGSLGKDNRGASESDGELKKVYVDLIALIKASRKDNLENVLNELLDVFPLVKTAPAPLVVMEDWLDTLSSKVSAYDTKSLLQGIAGEEVIKRVIDVASTQQDVLKKTFNNNYNVVLLYKHLNKYIDIELINQEIVAVTTIIPDPCFINLGQLGTEDLQLLKDFLGDDADAYIDGLINDASNQINSACSKFADGLYKTSLELPNLISESSKKALQGMVDTTLNPLIGVQNNSKSQFLASLNDIIKEMKKIYAGPKEEQTQALELGTGKTVSLKNVLAAKQQLGNLDVFEKNALDNKKTVSFFTHSLYANFKGEGRGVYGKIGGTGIDPFSLNVDNDGFFNFFVNQLNEVDPITTIDINEWLNKLEKTFEDDLDSVFAEADEIKKEAEELFNQAINEGGKNTNMFVSNMKAMKKIIKSIK